MRRLRSGPTTAPAPEPGPANSVRSPAAHYSTEPIPFRLRPIHGSSRSDIAVRLAISVCRIGYYGPNHPSGGTGERIHSPGSLCSPSWHSKKTNETFSIEKSLAFPRFGGDDRASPIAKTAFPMLPAVRILFEACLMRTILLALVACLLWGLATAARAAEPAGKKPSKETANVSAEDIDRLIVQLGDDNAAKRAAARNQLEAVGEPAIAALKKAAESSDDPVVRKAARLFLTTLVSASLGSAQGFTQASVSRFSNVGTGGCVVQQGRPAGAIVDD